MKTPTGLLGSSRPARGGADALADAVQRVVLADDARAQMRSPASSTVAISSFSILPTGMPVQPEITSPTMCASTQTRISGVSPCIASSSALSLPSSARGGFGVERLGRRGGLPGSLRWRLLSRSRGVARNSRIFVTRSRSLSQRPCKSLSALRWWRASSAISPQPLGVIGADRRFALQDAGLHGEIVRCGVASSIAGGIEFWPRASRAQAVSSTLTALSGNWRSGR